MLGKVNTGDKSVRLMQQSDMQASRQIRAQAHEDAAAAINQWEEESMVYANLMNG